MSRRPATPSARSATVPNAVVPIGTERRRGVTALIGAVALGAVLVGCTSPPAETPAPPSPAPAPVGRVASENPGSVNAWWVDAPQGLVVIDSGRNVAMGRRIVEETRRTGRPVVAILLTHSHPDHVGGLGPLREAYPQAPIHASEATTTQMRSDPLGFYPLARSTDPDYPAQLVYPDRVVAPGADLDVAGMRLETVAFGPGESEAANAYYDPGSGALFAGDVTDDRATPALLEGNSCSWLTNIDQLQQRFPATREVHPGHGGSGSLAVQADGNREYLRTVRGLVRSAMAPDSPGAGEVGAAEQDAIISEIGRRYPGYPPVASLPLPVLQQANVAAVAGELAAEDPASLPAPCRS